MPFSVVTFFDVFARYNEAIWPLQTFAYLAGLLVLAVLFRTSRLSTIIIISALAAMWAINGIGYHWIFFTEINPVAPVFAALFVVQAVLLLAAPWLFSDLAFAVSRDARSLVGLAMIAFATLIYPAWGAFAGHSYPATPLFGVAPCPTTIFTVGVLLLGNWRAVRWLLIIPAIWSLIGGSAAILLRVPQDAGLLASLTIILALAIRRRRGLSDQRQGNRHGIRGISAR